MTHKKPVETVEREALCAVKDYRHSNKAAIANPKSRDAQREEYRQIQKLRTVADELIEAHHG